MRKEELEELDDWFGDVEDDDEGTQGLSADEEEPEEPDGSQDDSASEASPDEEVSHDDTEESASSESTSASTVKKSDDPYSWVAELPSEVRERAEALVRRDQSNTGRVAALRSRLDELEAEKEARKTAGTGAPSKGGTPTLEDVGEMSDDELDDFRKEFPSVAANVDKIVAQRIAKEREEILGQVRPIQEEQAQRKILAEKTHLRTEAEKIFDTANTGIHLEDVLQSEEWKEWLEAQPAAYQTFARTARDADSALKVLTEFDRYARATFGQDEPTPEPGEQQRDSSRADTTAARRKAALEGTSPASRTAQVDDSALGDYEAYFDEAVAKG